MRRPAALLFALLLVLAACGDDDTGTADDPTSTTTTAADTTTTTAAATTTAAPTTTATTANEALEAALALEGTYTGGWTNRTFQSAGPVGLTIEVNEEAQFALVTLDLGGNVFGGSDPDPILYEIDLVEDFDVLEMTDDLFGESTMEMDADGHFVLEAPSVPGLGGLALTVEGDFTADGFIGTYTIPDLAIGEFTILLNE